MVVSSHLRATSAPKCLPSLTSMAFSVHQYATVTTTNWKRNALFQECKASMSVHNVKKANLFAARKQRIKLPSSYDGCRISEFLREPSGTQAVLNTSALQDFQTLDTNTYRCFLPKLQLLNFEAAPVLDLRVTPTEEDCTVEMLSCKFGNCSVDTIRGWTREQLVIDRSEKNFYVFLGKANKMSTNLTLRSILDANKLTGHNYSDWLRNLRIVLRQEKKLYVLDTPAPSEPCSDATDEEWEKYQRYIDDNEQATCVMLACMSPELQRQHENMDAPTMILHLKELFGAQSRVERYQISKALFQCKMAEGSSVNTHVLKMIGYIEKLAELGFVMDHELSIDLVLQSLSSSFSQFVMNFNMNQKDMTLPELLNMLKTAEGCLKKEPSSVLVVSSSKSKKKSFKKIKNKKQKASTNVVKAKGGVKKKSNDKGTCFNCGIDGHWKRNCPSYLASLKEKRLKEAGSSDVNKE